ncbi:Pre-mRNA 3'-end-processing endonuclease polyadenylation factor C-term [Piptocephalis cylindrospora]|uniref:Pre-mRNA 3'-end-processing endonuclease polyadenylation factor C-term n=1 Tax=Piptocephalis cylindrospora TaxID=1907219 RepID=A0A4P9Y210_9FUNG|nr:Pre-mRNA 3'-end-processing endonuclease polyadenylation factor C-term [Piptocephalis cylindrospora]|eukprot:RKP12835.1 Pre-mRNA 3'-end-processing endonuclease polyadenylation factor C-term [Piptocephalis cylindrospora]
MAIKAPIKEEKIDGILVSKGFEFNILSPEDLTDLTNLTTSSLRQQISLPFRPHPSLLLLHLRQMWGQRGVNELEKVKGASGEETREFMVYDAITITWQRRRGQGKIDLAWEGGDPAHDGMADAVLALILGIESSPASVKASHTPCKGGHGHKEDEGMKQEETVKQEEGTNQKEDMKQEDMEQKEMGQEDNADNVEESLDLVSSGDKIKKMRTFLEARYDKVMEEDDDEEDIKDNSAFHGPRTQFNITLDGLSATVRMANYSVKAEDKSFEENVQRIVSHLARSMEPIRPL